MIIFKKLSQKLKNPEQVQAYLYDLKYNRELKAETVRSALTTYQKQEGHCLEATLLAAAILEHRDYPPLILSLDSVDHLNHSVFIFKAKTGWGSIGKSREPGLHGREPRYRNILDLALSYYDPFIDKTGKLVAYLKLNLDDSQTDWRFSKRNLWKLEKFVVYTPHLKLPASPKRSKEHFKQLHESYLKMVQWADGTVGGEP